MEGSCYSHHGDSTSMDCQSMEPAYYPSYRSSPWPSSDGISDSCSGTWSSPAASESYSPEPNPAIHPEAYIGGQRDTTHDAFRSYPTLSAVQTHPDPVPGYFPAPVQYPPYWQQLWEYAPQQQVPVTFSAEEETTWVTDVYPGSSFDQASEPSPSPRPVPEIKSPPKRRRGRKPAPRQRIKREQSSPKRIEALDSIQETPQHSTHTFPAGSCPAKGSSFPCPLAIYGCTSSFVSKNEWKRHINTQHLCLETWRCDQCTPQRNARTNDFNRKDLFIQHLRRMHCPSPCPCPAEPASKKPGNSSRARHPPQPPSNRRMENSERALCAAERRCHVVMRAPPTRCACPFCEADFAGPEAWAAWTEHLAKHLEGFRRAGRAAPDPATWNRDRELERWLLDERVLVAAKGKALQLKSQTRP